MQSLWKTSVVELVSSYEVGLFFKTGKVNLLTFTFLAPYFHSHALFSGKIKYKAFFGRLCSEAENQ